MKKNYADLAEEYYSLMAEKKIEEMKRYLHPDINFKSPLGSMEGKEAVLEGIKGFMELFKSLAIRSKFGSENEAVIIYDLDIPGIANNFPTASLIRFQEGLIINVELFYNGIPFAK